MILDYEDMVKNGMVKEAQAFELPDVLDRKYAVMIKEGEDFSGKFDITDAESVKRAIYALENNTAIPSEVRSSAEYFTKQAAEHFGIEFDCSPKEAPHVIIVNNSIPKIAESKTVPVLKFSNGKTFVLKDYESVKTAEDYFVSYKDAYEPDERIRIAKIIVKEAMSIPSYFPEEPTRKYANARYNIEGIKEGLAHKMTLIDDNDYRQVLTKIASEYSSIPVDKFLSLIHEADRIAGVTRQTFPDENFLEA